MSGFKKRFSHHTKLEGYIENSVQTVSRRMALHVDKFDSFANELRPLIEGVDFRDFKHSSIEDIYHLIIKHEQKIQTLMFLAFVEATRLESPAADLFIDIIESNRPALEVIAKYLVTDSWPRSFHGMNMLTHVSRTDKIFTNAIVAPLIRLDRKNVLPSNKVSGPITSLFLLLKEFAWETRDSHLYM